VTAYPEAEDYIRAVQQPERSFLRPELRSAVFDVHPVFRIPMPAAGNAAVVFKARLGGSDAALRFFIREDASSRERYTALGEHFADRGIEDCVAHPTWIDGAISLNEGTWPMVRMTWVDGRTLDAYVGHLASTGDVGALASLATTWRDLVSRLQAAEFAHGDLQHGNVLVDTSSSLRLVDFDGSWIAAFSGGAPPRETGHPNYQRTGREWGRWMDTFPGLVVYTALLVLSRQPAAWARLHTGENILFSAEDFAPPFRTPTWQTVSGIGDAEIEHAAERLRHACRSGAAADTLESLLTTRPRIEVDQPRRPVPEAPIYPGVHLPHQATPWWQRTGSPAADREPVGAPAGRPGPGHSPGTPPAPGAMPPPPPKTGPGGPGRGAPVPGAPAFGHTAPRGAWYSASVPPTGPPTPAQPGRPPVGAASPAGPASARPVGQVLSLLLLIVGLAAFVAGGVVQGAGGNGAVAAVLSGLVAAAVAAPLLLRRKP
jgi:hypothetical protein